MRLWKAVAWCPTAIRWMVGRRAEWQLACVQKRRASRQAGTRPSSSHISFLRYIQFVSICMGFWLNVVWSYLRFADHAGIHLSFGDWSDGMLGLAMGRLQTNTMVLGFLQQQLKEGLLSRFHKIPLQKGWAVDAVHHSRSVDRRVWGASLRAPLPAW